MVINQRIEDKLGAKRHGSVGVGFNETHVRSGNDSLKITMADLWNRTPIRDKLAEICGKYAKFRTGSPIEDPDKMIAAFEYACEETAARIHPGGIGQCAKLDPVFEGAQGLLLSHDNKEFFPHVTRSATGMTNVRTLCAQAGIEKIEGYYISRTYLTRHGAGPLPGEDPGLKYADNTNVPHSYQGRLRFAKLDSNALLHRIEKDWGGPGAKLVLTHCDQEDAPFRGDFMSHGPKRTDVQKVTR
jgi:adenylosuccinate synthase